MTIEVLGRDRAVALIDGRPVEFTARHSEILALLALEPTGTTVRRLAAALYGSTGRDATVRGEVARLRPLLGSFLRSRPYRLGDGVEVDVATVQQHLERGRMAQARLDHVGPLLPTSTAPGIGLARDRLARLMQPRAASAHRSS